VFTLAYTGKAMSVIRDGLLLTTDAVRRPGLNVVLCGDMEQQRLNFMRFNQNSLRMLTLFW